MIGYPRHYGKYVLLEPIGAGGMSEVDLAHSAMEDTSFVRFVAIKRVAKSNVEEETFVRMFMDEARINQELHHGNIVGVYDFGKQVDRGTGREEYFMVMEYVPGLDLRAIQRAAHRRGHRLPLRFCFSVLCEVLRGLQYAHHKADTIGRPMNLVHRDINPRNVMISVRGEVKVIDFGVALAEDRMEKTQGRSLKGKFAYMSPEQIEGSVTLDGRTDLYAVGLMLHELVGGVGPFHGLTELQIMHRIVMGQLPPLQIPPEFPDSDFLLQIHGRALARERERRYPNARAFRKALERAAEMVGGVSDQQERAALIRSLDPQQVDGISARLRGYHESSASVSRSVSRAIMVPTREASSSDVTLATAESTADFEARTQEVSGDPAAPPAKRRRSLWLLLLAGAAVAGLAMTVLGGGGLLWWSSRESTSEVPPTTLDDLVQIELDRPVDGEGARDDDPGSAVPAEEELPVEEAATQSSSSGGAGGTGHSSSPTGSSQAAASSRQPVATHDQGSAQAPEQGDAGEDRGAESGTATEDPVTQDPQADQAPGTAELEPESTPSEPVPDVVTEPEQATTAADGPKGQLLVNSEPKGQPVSVDGQHVGVTPYKAMHTEGSHQVLVIGPGGQQCNEQASVSTSRPVLVRCPFTTQQGGTQNDDNRRQR